MAAERAALAAERTALEAARQAVREDLERRQALSDELAGHEAVTAEPVFPEAGLSPVAGTEPGSGVQASATGAGPAGLDAVPLADRVLAGVAGARLCFGEPLEAQGRTVVPVARVRAAGGLGTPRAGRRAGGGGRLDARPVGVLEVGPDGVRFTRVPTSPAFQAAGAGAAAAAVLTGAATALRLLGRGRRGRGLGRRR